MSIRFPLCPASLACVAVGTSALAQVPVLEISGANFRPMPLAVAAPKSQDPRAKALSAEFDDTLTFDLSASGIFQVLDRKSFLADPNEGVTASSISFGRWATVGADGLVKTQLSSEGDQIRADLRFFSVGTGKEEIKLTLAVPERGVRRLAHFLANGLYRRLTREPGPFESHLAYVKKSAQGKEIWFSDWDGKSAQLVAGGANVLNILPALLPDSSGVAFTTYRTGKPAIFVQRFGSPAMQLVKADHMATGIAFSPDGKRIAYSLASSESTQVWVAQANGSGAKQLTDTPYFINTSPSWAPDGKRIAFVSNRGGSPQIYVMDADGRGVRRLTFQGNYNQTPDWSPRGDLIAFTARDERRAFDLFTVNVDTGKVTRLTQDQGDNQEPTFSPNGRLIIFSSNRTSASRLFVMSSDGTNQLPLPMEGGVYSTPDWGR
jgi:TolB protein